MSHAESEQFMHTVLDKLHNFPDEMVHQRCADIIAAQTDTTLLGTSDVVWLAAGYLKLARDKANASAAPRVHNLTVSDGVRFKDG